MKKITLLAMTTLVSLSSFAFAKDQALEELLPKKELEAIQLEARRQERKMSSVDKKEEEGGGNPYAVLLKNKGVKTQADKKEEAIAPKITRSRRSSYSKDYRRYAPGRNRPGDAFKSTPSQRAFGR